MAGDGGDYGMGGGGLPGGCEAGLFGFGKGGLGFFHPRQQAGEEFIAFAGFGIGEIGAFPDVSVEVIGFGGPMDGKPVTPRILQTFLMIKRELPVALADHSRGVGEEDRGAAPGNGLVGIAREVPEDRGAFPISGSGEKWQQAPAVKVCGGSDSGGVDISGVEIQVDDWHPAEVFGFDPARPAGEERPAEPAFIIAAFGPAQGRAGT
jgi:hypothetical protein